MHGDKAPTAEEVATDERELKWLKLAREAAESRVVSDDQSGATQKIVIGKGNPQLTDEAIGWLMKHRDWPIAYSEDDEYPDATDIVERRESPISGELALRRGLDSDDTSEDPGIRTSPDLIDCIDAIGEVAASENGLSQTHLKVVEIPADVQWEIQANHHTGRVEEYVAEQRRTWR